MASLTLSIPEDLRSQMKRYPEINWSEVARQAIVEKTQTLDKMQLLLEKSQLTEDEAVNLGRSIKKGVAKKHSK